MTAPALILLSEGSTDARVMEALHGLRDRMHAQRPELTVQLACLDHCPPSGPQVVKTLVKDGLREIVFVPLALTRATDPIPAADVMLANVRQHHPDVAAQLARPIGPATELLNILDVHLRDALSQAHATELDALVLSVPDNGDVRGAGLIQRRARQWGSHHKLPVSVAHADGSAASVGLAIRSLREVGRRNIAVGSMFLTRDVNWCLMADEAHANGAIAVSAPVGGDDRVLDLIMSRYAFAAMDLLDQARDAGFPDLDAAFSDIDAGGWQLGWDAI